MSIGVIDYVSAAQLPAYIRAQNATGTPFTVSPPGHRAFYCFGAMGTERHGLGTLPRGYDLCDGPEGALIALGARLRLERRHALHRRVASS